MSDTPDIPAPQRESEQPSSLAVFTGSASERFRRSILNDVLSCVVPRGASDDVRAERQGAALDTMAAFHPRDEIDAMFASASIALHAASMEAMRRAAHHEMP